MRLPRFLRSLNEKLMRFLRPLNEKLIGLAGRHPRGFLISGIVCLVIAFLPYYYHTAADGPAEVEMPFFGKVKGPPERTFFYVGLPWSPWVKYWRVLEYQGPFAFNYSWGWNAEIFSGSAIPALLGAALLFVRRRARRAQAAERHPAPARADEGPGPSPPP
jgi:hypothetical protein